MEKNEAIEKDTAGGPRKGDKVDKALGLTANARACAEFCVTVVWVTAEEVAPRTGS